MTVEEILALLERTHSDLPIAAQTVSTPWRSRARASANDLRDRPWWTEADAAELDLEVRELVNGVHDHRDAGCETCVAGYPPCPFVGAAIDRVVDWRDERTLRSQAAWLRVREDEA